MKRLTTWALLVGLVSGPIIGLALPGPHGDVAPPTDAATRAVCTAVEGLAGDPGTWVAPWRYVDATLDVKDLPASVARERLTALLSAAHRAEFAQRRDTPDVKTRRAELATAVASALRACGSA
jgi:hypothetical protein